MKVIINLDKEGEGEYEADFSDLHEFPPDVLADLHLHLKEYSEEVYEMWKEKMSGAEEGDTSEQPSE